MPANLGQPFAQLKLAKHLTYKHMCMSEELSYIDFNMGIFILLKNHYPPPFSPQLLYIAVLRDFFSEKTNKFESINKSELLPRASLIHQENWLTKLA